MNENGEQRTRKKRGMFSPIPKGKLFKDQIPTKPGPGSKYEIPVDGKYRIQEEGGGDNQEDIEKLIKLGRVKLWVIRLDLLNTLMIFHINLSITYGMDPRQTIQYVVQTNDQIIKRCILMTSMRRNCI